MVAPNLVTIDVAARELGVPKGSLRAAAEQHGLLVYIGRAVRIDRNSYGELIEKCRAKPQEQGSISVRTRVSSTSVTQDAPTVQPALDTAMMLKRRLPPTSSARAPSPMSATQISSQ